MFLRNTDFRQWSTRLLMGALIFSLAALMLIGCESTQQKFEKAEITSLMLTASQFDGVTPQLKKRDVFCGRQEYAVWNGWEEYVRIFLMIADAGCVVLDSDLTAEQSIENWSWLRKGKIIREKRSLMVNAPLGSVWVSFFRRNNRPCIIFRHSFGQTGSSINTDSHRMSGYYCGSSGAELSEKDAEYLVKSIRLRGAPLHEASKSYPRTGTTPLSKAQRRDMESKARQGDKEAMYKLALRLKKSNERQAWLCRAANGGHTEAQYYMGYKFENGLAPLAVDHVRASMWYRLSQRDGYEAGASAQQRLTEILTAKQKARAKRLVAEWKPGQCEAEAKRRR